MAEEEAKGEGKSESSPDSLRRMHEPALQTRSSDPSHLKEMLHGTILDLPASQMPFRNVQVNVLEMIGKAVEEELQFRRDTENLFLKLPHRERTRMLGYLSGSENIDFNYAMVNRSGRRALMSAYLLRDKNDSSVGEIRGFTFPIEKLTRVEYRHLNQEELCPGLDWALNKGVNCRDYFLEIPSVPHDEHLLMLIKTGRLKMAKILLKYCKSSYDFNSTDNFGWTALHMACYWNEIDIVRIMCTNPDVNVNALDKQDGQAPLHHVAIWGHTEIAGALVREGGANVNAVDKYGMTPVHKVCRNNCIGIAKILVESGKANLEAQDIHGVRPLHKACIRGHVEMVDFLLEHGALLNPLEKMNKTPLDYALNNERTDVVDFLNSRNALTGEEELRRIEGEKYSMHNAVKGGDMTRIQNLANDSSVNVHRKDYNDETPLHVAARYNQVDAARFLIVEGTADVNVVDRRGWTPLHEAAKYGHNDIVSLLVTKTANVNAINNEYHTAAAVAFNSGNIKTAALLAEYGGYV